MDSNQKVTQAIVTNQTTLSPHQKTERFALFDATGAPVVIPAAPSGFTGTFEADSDVVTVVDGLIVSVAPA